VIKRGRKGSLLCTRQGVQEFPIFDIETVDTTGAGDAFTAALIVGLAEGLSLSESVQLGTAAGAIAVSRFGTMPAMPRRCEVEDFLRRKMGS
jgi:ribokinase